MEEEDSDIRSHVSATQNMEATEVEQLSGSSLHGKLSVSQNLNSVEEDSLVLVGLMLWIVHYRAMITLTHQEYILGVLIRKT